MNAALAAPNQTPGFATSSLRSGCSGTPSPAIFVAIFLIAVLPTVLWPGDVSWINDEPRLIAAAWHANDAHTLATGGLYGNFGVRYGPLPTQIYQALLLLTHDPVTLALLRSLFCASVTTGSLLWLARSLRFSPWFVAAVGLAPQVWQFQRVLWDASFAMPLGALALAAFAAFLSQRDRWKLLVGVGATVLLPLIHPQDLPLCAALGGAILWQAHRELWLWRRSVIVLLTLLFALNAVYLAEVCWALIGRLGGAVREGYPAGQSHWQAALAPFLGGNLMSDYKFSGAVTVASRSILSKVATELSRLVYPLAWVGIALLAKRALSGALSKRDLEPRESVARIVLVSLVFQALLFGLMRVPAEPQYFFGSFVIQALLPWFALEALRSLIEPLGLALTAAYGAAVGFVTLHGAWSIHNQGYGTDPIWLTLGNQAEVVRRLSASREIEAVTDVPMLQLHPHSLRALRLLIPPAAAAHPHGHWWLRTSPDPAAPRGHIEAVELTGSTTAPAGTTPLDLTPLPAGWQPASK